MIPFSPPRIDDKIIEEVSKVLRSGWITTGPKTKLFEQKITAYCGNKKTLCVNSATAGLELVLRWFGVKEGDEVVLPAYTYSATANVIVHCGAKPVFVDVNQNDFNINIAAIRKAITKNTKVIMPVDFGGLPCDYDEINDIAENSKDIFSPNSEIQKKLGRILVLSDAAHSFGAMYNGKKSGSLTDISVFSFHAVKNLTTAEGGAIALNLSSEFDNNEVYDRLCITSLHGQTKDALSKTQMGNWQYDIVEAGYKCNMTDICAAIGLIELERYNDDTLRKRKSLAEAYCKLLGNTDVFELPVYTGANKESCYHLFPLRIKNASREVRDAIIQDISNNKIGVNVHFIPVPMMSFYENMGYKMEDYPNALDNFNREISLPLYYDLTLEQVSTVVNQVKRSVEKAMAK
ncbi:MAG: DegT/DnrJ/EryC1/StrS family aminotransferase [Bacteroidia bacterium]